MLATVLTLMLVTAEPATPAASTPSGTDHASPYAGLDCLVHQATKVDDGVAAPGDVARKLDGACPEELARVVDQMGFTDPQARAGARLSILLHAVMIERMMTQKFPIKKPSGS